MRARALLDWMNSDLSSSANARRHKSYRKSKIRSSGKSSPALLGKVAKGVCTGIAAEDRVETSKGRLDKVTMDIIEYDTPPQIKWNFGCIINAYPGDDSVRRVTDMRINKSLTREPLTEFAIFLWIIILLKPGLSKHIENPHLPTDRHQDHQLRRVRYCRRGRGCPPIKRPII